MIEHKKNMYSENTVRDSLRIEGIEVSCSVGESEEERAFPQILYISVELAMSLRTDDIQDDIERTVDYVRLVDDVRDFLKTNSFALIETIADRVAERLLNAHSVERVFVEVTKKALIGVQGVRASVHRGRMER